MFFMTWSSFRGLINALKWTYWDFSLQGEGLVLWSTLTFYKGWLNCSVYLSFQAFTGRPERCRNVSGSWNRVHESCSDTDILRFQPIRRFIKIKASVLWACEVMKVRSWNFRDLQRNALRLTSPNMQILKTFFCCCI